MHWRNSTSRTRAAYTGKRARWSRSACRWVARLRGPYRSIHRCAPTSRCLARAIDIRLNDRRWSSRLHVGYVHSHIVQPVHVRAPAWIASPIDNSVDISCPDVCHSVIVHDKRMAHSDEYQMTDYLSCKLGPKINRTSIVHSFLLQSAMYCDCMSSVCPSVCLSVCNVGGSGPHRLEILETNCTDN